MKIGAEAAGTLQVFMYPIIPRKEKIDESCQMDVCRKARPRTT